MRRIGLLTLLVCAVTALTPAAQSPVLDLGVNGRDNRFVSAAADDTVVVLAWAGIKADGTTDIYAATSRNGGASFAPPVRVNATPGQARVNGEQPPRVALVPRAGGEPEVVVVWTARAEQGTRLLSARSRDGGRTFGASAVVPGTAAAGNRGWFSAAVTTAGQPIAMWLDHRDTASSSSGSGGHAHGGHAEHGSTAAGSAGQAGADHAPREDGVARAQRSQLFFGGLDASRPATALVRGVCYCCKTSLVAGAGNTLYAAWRHVYAGNQRDIAFTLSRDGGRTFSSPVRISEDRWQVDGCPENGPSLAVHGSRVHAVWPTLLTQGGAERMALFHARSDDGRTFSARQPLPTSGSAYHPQAATASDGRLEVVWEETAAGGRRVKFWRGGRAEDLGAGAYPAIVTASPGSVVAWSRTQGKLERIAVRTIAR